MNFVSAISNSGVVTTKSEYLSLNDEHQFCVVHVVHARKSFDFDRDFTPLLSLQRLNLDFSLFFHRLTDRVSTNAFVTAFQSSLVREIVTQRTSFFFTFELSRIALIITIRIATINCFAVSIAVPTVFNTSPFTNLARIPVHSLAAASPITASWQRIARRRLQLFRRCHSVFQLVSSCFSIFSIYLTH